MTNIKSNEANHLKFMTEYKLTDVWRDMYPDKRVYTWFRKGNNISASRIDYLLTNVGLASDVKSVNITAGCRTDHSMVEVKKNLSKPSTSQYAKIIFVENKR